MEKEQDNVTDATSTTQEGVQTEVKKPISARSILAEFRPEMTFDNDDDALEALCEECKADKSRLKDMEVSNKRIYELIEANPVLADVIMAMDEGVPFEVALAKNVDLEALTPLEGEDSYNDYVKASSERKERAAQIAARRADLEANQSQSKVDADEFFAELGIDETEQEAFVDFVDSFIGDLFAGKVSKPTLKKMYQAFKYEEDIQIAQEQGKTEGRNEKIETKRQITAATDGLPSPGTGVEAEPKPKRKIFNI